ncbi:MAG: N-acetylneuraminate synthase family protein, partial [Syntrophorhabdaceae bacterium]|nr:N-acetylneuraminate synthase family protein [Syntrophorhabdaceae bacterium]
VIEKHFTLDRSLPGPDHKASVEPGELAEMVHAIRAVERYLGSERKGPTPSEMKNRDIVRKSLVAGRPIKKGELFSPENLTFKRPGKGLSPMVYWKLLGKRSGRDYDKDEMILDTARRGE